MILNKGFYLFIILFLFSKTSINAKNLTFHSNIFFGYDSNPLRLSDDEINNLDIYPYILQDSKEVYSMFTGFNTKLIYKLLPRKKKLTLSFNLKGTYHYHNQDKSSMNFTFKIDKSLGGYKHFIFYYFVLPNYYLREYEDKDQVICINLEDCIFSTYFSNDKIKLSYLIPIERKISTLKFGLIYERELYDHNFTEYDLEKKGPFIEYKIKNNQYNYSMLYEYLYADNYTFLDGLLSTIYMDRSYNQHRFKFSMQKKNIDNSKGLIIDIYKRENTSNLNEDHLHFNRRHIDTSISFWYKYKSNKILFLLRNRRTDSPYNWVEDLKTFNRFIITFTRFFNKVEF